jgi:hypothetical protein
VSTPAQVPTEAGEVGVAVQVICAAGSMPRPGAAAADGLGDPDHGGAAGSRLDSRPRGFQPDKRTPPLEGSGI